MHRILRRSIPPSLRAIESASRRPTLCFVVRDDENKTGGMIVREKNLPAEVGKTQTPPRSASEVIAEMAAKVARYPAKPKEEWEGMSAEERALRERRICEAVEMVSPRRRTGTRSDNSISALYCITRRGRSAGLCGSGKWYRRAAEHAATRNCVWNAGRSARLCGGGTKWYRTRTTPFSERLHVRGKEAFRRICGSGQVVSPCRRTREAKAVYSRLDVCQWQGRSAK